MVKLDPSIRLKVKRDTFYLPEPNRGVYLRNNSCSFRIDGSGMDQWVEKLLPMFNGEYTLGKLTEGLPEPYRDRVYEIAEVLYRNGVARDVSGDRSYQLPEHVLEKYAFQIEFVDSIAGSGASRFQDFREANVLAVGSGPILNSLVSSLIESGLAKLHVLITDEAGSNRQRLMELVDHARKTDHEVDLQEVTLHENGWREAIKPFDSILYVTHEGNLEELRILHAVCREEKKTFLPAVCLKQTGIAGPLVHPGSDVCWESVWRRLHSTVLDKEQLLNAESSTPGALLANVIVFELFKEVTGVTETEQKNRFYLLNLETLEGSWHSFLPHPLETGEPTAEYVEDFDLRLERDVERAEPEKLLLYFSVLTSKETGIFHIWEEGDLKQLPLAQCRVQSADPLSEGPAELLQEMVCTGLTHEEARREAGLTGIEAYALRMASLIQSDEFIGVGAGETFAESVGRGLQKCLADELSKQLSPSISRVKLDAIEDERCRFYLEALTTMQEAPIIGLGEEVSGFPSIWVGTRDGWYGSADLNITRALRKSLQHALFNVQNHSDSFDAQVLDNNSAVFLEERDAQMILSIPACEERIQPEMIQAAKEALKKNGKQLFIYELGLEPVFKQELEGVFGVLLRKEELS